MERTIQIIMIKINTKLHYLIRYITQIQILVFTLGYITIGVGVFDLWDYFCV